jgi:nucleotide-binding universal stress UspA family protein
MYHKILVPLDGSKRAEAILPHVEELAHRYEAKVVFVQVIEYKVATSPEGAFTALTDQEFDQIKKRAEAYLAGIQGVFREKKVETKTHIVHGPVVEAILKIAAQEAADLIAMASHGRGGLSRVFYGSVAAGILQRIDRPLLIIRSS